LSLALNFSLHPFWNIDVIDHFQIIQKPVNLRPFLRRNAKRHPSAETTWQKSSYQSQIFPGAAVKIGVDTECPVIAKKGARAGLQDD